MENIKTYITDAGLGYKQFAILIRLNKSKNGYNYLCIDTNASNSSYVVGELVEDLENFYVSEHNYDIKKSELYTSFLFNFFIQNYKNF